MQIMKVYILWCTSLNFFYTYSFLLSIYTVPLSPASFTSEFKRQHWLDLYIVYLMSFNSLNTWNRKILNIDNFNMRDITIKTRLNFQTRIFKPGEQGDFIPWGQ